MKSDELSIYSDDLAELLLAVINKGAAFRFEARGFSMSPFIKHGDIITVAPLRKGSVGHIVACKNPVNRKLIVHRIIKKLKKGFLIKGDNCATPDDVIPEDNILGYVEKIERKGKRVYTGLGPEGIIIAWLSRLNILIKIIYILRLIIPSFIRSLL